MSFQKLNEGTLHPATRAGNAKVFLVKAGAHVGFKEVNESQ